MRRIFSLLILSLTFVSFNSFAEHPSSFSKAKKIAQKLYKQEQVSFYCGCRYNDKKQVNADTCGYTARKQPRRGKRIEWEHIVSAWEIGHQRKCWQEGGRKNCKKTDKQFVKMTSDLHNLVPAVGELNGDRSNYRFGMLEKEVRHYGKCDFEVDFKLRRAEPIASRQGDIARIYFYMRDQYGLRISKQQTRLFEAWSRMDPVDNEELQRDQRIAKVQGNSNCYVTGKCQLKN